MTGDKIYWDNTTNSGINTGIYFVTAINQTEFYLSYSGSDVFAKKYIAVRTDTTGQFIYKSGWENKTLKNQKILRKYPNYKQKTLFDDKNQRQINNRAVGLLANGVELFPPTVFDEQIFHGDITEIKVTNSGKDYDVITGCHSSLTINKDLVLLVMLMCLDPLEKLNWLLLASDIRKNPRLLLLVVTELVPSLNLT